MLKAVIFDLDNTLVDFMKFKKACCESAVSAMIKSGLNINRQKAMKVLYEIYSECGMEDPLIFQKFLERISGSVDYRKLARAVNAYRIERQKAMAPYPGARKTLEALKSKKLKLAVVSDAPKLKAWLRLTAIKLDNFFDAVIALEDTGRKKPSRLPFKAALKALKVKPEECLMVGDSASKDMKGAKLMGMKTCLAVYGAEGNPKGKWDFKADKISDIEVIAEAL